MTIIVIHIGAGYFAEAKREDYRRLLSDIYKEIKQCKDKRTLEETATDIITNLERSGCVNAGIGSSLNRKLCIENDCILMNGKRGTLSVVGAVPNETSTSRIALSLYQESLRGDEEGSVIRPCMLMGDQVNEYSKSKGLNTSTRICIGTYNISAIPKASKKRGERYQRVLKKKQKLSTGSTVSDTVGCMLIDEESIVIMSCSGGNWLHLPGRVGLCGCPGAGVWCNATCGCMCSGTGESCIRCLAAKSICDQLERGDCSPSMFIKDVLLRDETRTGIMNGGGYGIVTCKRDHKDIHITISHSSPMFYVLLANTDSEEIEIYEKQPETTNRTCEASFVYHLE